MIKKKIDTLDGESILNAFINGAERVISCRLILNKINYFPVADNDTGNNLAVTLSSIKDIETVSNFPRTMLIAISDACLLSARGNSGLIFSQFFHGLTMECPNTATLTVAQFSHLLCRAVLSVREAIVNPATGTVLTLMEDWSNFCKNNVNIYSDFSTLFEKSMPKLNDSLVKTAIIQKVNKANMTVDAGAQGFYYFVEGIQEYFSENFEMHQRESLLQASIKMDQTISHHFDKEPIFRYCTEAVITTEHNNVTELKALLMHHGDSVVVAGGNKRFRIHLHTNDPCELFSSLHNTSFQLPKVDDMLSQYTLAKQEKKNMALVTDSIADLPCGLIEKYNIYVIPISIIFGDSVYLDKCTITSANFYQKISTCLEYPTSAIPTSAYVKQLLEYLNEHYLHIMIITVSSKLSGMFDLVSQISTRYPNIEVIDSKKNSGAQGLLVKQCAELIHSNHFTFDEIIQQVKKSIDETYIFVLVNDFRYMIRSGRVSRLKGTIANLLNLKPIIGLDKNGFGAVLAKAMSSNSATKKIVNLIKKESYNKKINQYCILHANAAESADTFSQKIEKNVGLKASYTMEVSPVIGLHAGVGAIAIAIQFE